MQQTITNTDQSFFTKNKELLIVGGTILALAGAGFTWYYFKKKKQQESDSSPSEKTLLDSDNPLRTLRNANGGGSRIVSQTIQYGSRGANVTVLQRYLKIYKEDLGTSGANKDGVDGVFGAKTVTAAKKHLGKAVFTQADIEGMRKTLNSMGK